MFGVLRPECPSHGPNFGGHAPHDTPPPPPPPNSLAPMPPSEFTTREEVLAGAKSWSATQGYAIVIARSRQNRLWLKCDRGGKYENRRGISIEQRKRKRGGSRLQGCPFRMIAAFKRDARWHVECDQPEHNHGPSEDLSAHPTLRRMTESQLDIVHQMCDRGDTPADTVRELKRLWPDINVLTRDVYNARKKYKTTREEKAIEAEAEAAEGVGWESGQYDETRTGQDEAQTERSNGGNAARGKRVGLVNSLKANASSRKRASRNGRGSYADGPILDPRLQGAEHEIPLPTAHASQAVSTGTRQPRHPMPPPFAHSNSPNDLREPLIPALDDEPIDLIDSSTPPASAFSGPNPMSDPGLLSRIDTIEREQREQKNMLAEILGAVRGMQAVKAPSSRKGPGGARASASASN